MPIITIDKIFHNKTKKDGTPYISKKGRPFEVVNIFCKDKEGVEQKLSGFGNDVTHSWQVGDKVEVLVERKGDYLNFSLPEGAQPNSPTNNLEQDVATLKSRVALLEAKLKINGATEIAEQYGGEVVANNQPKEICVEDIDW